METILNRTLEVTRHIQKKILHKAISSTVHVRAQWMLTNPNSSVLKFSEVGSDSLIREANWLYTELGLTTLIGHTYGSKIL